MAECAPKYVGENFHVVVRMGREPAIGCDDVLIDHTEATESHVLGVEVVGE